MRLLFHLLTEQTNNLLSKYQLLNFCIFNILVTIRCSSIKWKNISKVQFFLTLFRHAKMICNSSVMWKKWLPEVPNVLLMGTKRVLGKEVILLVILEAMTFVKMCCLLIVLAVAISPSYGMKPFRILTFTRDSCFVYYFLTQVYKILSIK